MRAVLDTNILARAVPGQTGPAREVLELLSVSPHVLVTAPALLDIRIVDDLALLNELRALGGPGPVATQP